eukprot:4271670-Pyramimonas_sp.AAC.1
MRPERREMWCGHFRFGRVGRLFPQRYGGNSGGKVGRESTLGGRGKSQGRAAWELPVTRAPFTSSVSNAAGTEQHPPDSLFIRRLSVSMARGPNSRR